MLPQICASDLSTDCDNSQEGLNLSFESTTSTADGRVYSLHLHMRACLTPGLYEMTCLVDTQPLSQNRSSAIAALTDDFIHTARHGPDRTDKACTKPRKPPLQP